MKPVGVFYATREGQTRRIAGHIVSYLRTRDIQVDLRDVSVEPKTVVLTNYSAAIFAASIHVGRHEREMVDFIKHHSSDLQAVPTAFLSVNLSEAGVERTDSTPEARAKCASDVQTMLDRFLNETRWKPDVVKPVAGALRYSQYNPIKRFIMKRIAKSAGADTDTSRDHEYTDWVALDRFVDEFTMQLV